ncbi:MAG TPA: glycosyltransferase family 2 protein [Lacipirellulaceae bacterium]|nr:glycosyltransferase family 2 protein [Lacipirellulaceae bacterium]
MKLSVVIPLYNEVDNVGPLVASFKSALGSVPYDYELIAVDDGSTDDTREALARLVQENQNLRLVELRRNYGQTAAMSAGIEYASGEVIVTIDGDMQNDPADIPAMVAKIDEGYDLVHGWRKDRQDPWLSRRLPSLLANRLISAATGFPCHDLGCTLKALRREIAVDLRLYGEMHRFIPILAGWHGAKCTELVTRHHPRRHGKSKYGILRTFAVLLDLITVLYITRFSLKPMRLFGGLGALSMLGGMALGAAAIVLKLVTDFDLTGDPLLYASFFGVMIGLQFMLMGMTAEMSTRTHYESQQRRPYAVSRFRGFDGALTNIGRRSSAVESGLHERAA